MMVITPPQPTAIAAKCSYYVACGAVQNRTARPEYSWVYRRASIWNRSMPAGETGQGLYFFSLGGHLVVALAGQPYFPPHIDGGGVTRRRTTVFVASRGVSRFGGETTDTDQCTSRTLLRRSFGPRSQGKDTRWWSLRSHGFERLRSGEKQLQ